MSELPLAGDDTAVEGPDTDDSRKELMGSIAESIRGSFQTVEDMAQAFIRESIIQGAFPPGYRLNLDEIASMLGVSRISVRSTLRALEAEGLLTIHTRRGATVAVLTSKEIAEIYEMRMVLECHLLTHLIEHVDDELVAKLRELVVELEATKDLGVRLARRKVFYDTLYERADRPRTLAQLQYLRGAVGRHLLLQRAEVDAVHGAFLDYLEDRDLQGAQRWLTEHLTHVSQQQRRISEEPSAIPSPAPTSRRRRS